MFLCKVSRVFISEFSKESNSARLYVRPLTEYSVIASLASESRSPSIAVSTFAKSEAFVAMLSTLATFA
jgi:hypothetical protein